MLINKTIFTQHHIHSDSKNRRSFLNMLFLPVICGVIWVKQADGHGRWR